MHTSKIRLLQCAVIAMAAVLWPAVASARQFDSADISITKTDSPDPVNAGTNLTYTITVSNNGPDPADNTELSDTLPPGTAFVSLSQPAGWSCTTPAVGASGSISCSIPSLAVGSGLFTLVVAVDASIAAGTVLSNTATVGSTTADPTAGNNSATATTTVAGSADLSITKTDSPDPVTAGNNLTYQITLTNNGPSNAASASFSDTLPAGTTFESLSTTGSWSCTTPAIGDTGTISCTNASFAATVDFFTLVVKVAPSTAAGTVLSNTATLGSSTSDPTPGNNSATATTTVTASADLSITKTDTPDPVTAGNELTYTITVSNSGPSDAATVSWSDTLPAGTTFVSLTQDTGPTFSCTPGATISCSIGSLPAGSAAAFTLVVAVDAGIASGTVLSNTATVSSSTIDPTPGNNSSTATTTVTMASADLSISKVDTPDPVTAGTTLTYTITVTNSGPNSAATASLSDTLPAGTTFLSLSSPGSWSCTTPAVGAGGTIACSMASFGIGGASFTLTVRIPSSVASGALLSNTATFSSSTSDPTPGNNSSTATTTVTTTADLSVTSSDTPDPVTVGSNLAYHFVVRNFGPSDAVSASLSDTLPANTTFVSLASPAGWSCTTPAVGGTGSVSCTNTSLDVIADVFTLVVAIDAGTAGGTVLSNTAILGSSTSDPTPGNNTSTETTTVTASADLAITKSAAGSVTFGQNIVYTITAANSGPSTAANVSVSDALPAGVTFVSATPAQGSCSGTSTVTCNLGSIASGAAAIVTLTVSTSGTTPASVGNTATVSSSTTDPNPANNSSTATVTMTRIDQTITFAPLGNRALGSGTFTVSATASSGLAVTFQSLTTPICDVSGNTVMLISTGTCTIAARQLGDSTYNAAPEVPQSFSVTASCSAPTLPGILPSGQVALPYNQTLTLTNGAAPVTMTLTGALPSGVTFANGVFTGTPTVRGAFPITVTATDANSCQVSASYPLAIAAERRLVIGAASDVSTVRAFNVGSAIVQSEISAFGAFAGGVAVAHGDVDGNSIADIIVGAGPGAGPAVRVFDGGASAARLTFFAFDPAYRGGVTVAAGDVTGDGVPDVLAATGCAGGPHVRAFDGRTGALVRAYTIPLPVPTCRLNVAAGDVTGDGIADVIVGTGDGLSVVEVLDGWSGVSLREFYPFGTAFTGGVNVAAGDVTGDGLADIVTGAGPGGTPHVRVFDGSTGSQIPGALGSFHAYVPLFSGGVRVGAGDLNGDGRAEVITVPGSHGGPHVRVFDGASATEIYGLYGFDPSFGGGLFVAGPTPSARMNVDIAARTIGTAVRIAGWALREIANDTTGTDAIHAWAYPVSGGAPVFVGEAPTRVPRPDIAAAFGGEFLMSGFDFSGTLSAGTYDLVVYVRNSRTRIFDLARVIRITVN